MSRALTCLATCAAACALASGDGLSPSTGLASRALPQRTVFVAMERDFQGFRAWGSEALVDLEAQGQTHPAGPRRLYVNALPPTPGSEFPVGTQIVKEAAIEPGGVVRLFGMVKRGGGFNAGGARDWEWFELKERKDGSVGIMWRGLGAPDGESYGGDPIGTCNTCHSRGAQRDHVKSERLMAALSMR